MDEDDLKATEARIEYQGGLGERDAYDLVAEVRNLQKRLAACTASHQRLNADYERAMELLDDLLPHAGPEVRERIEAFLGER
jgi:uncharacterized protein